ncbi:MAG: NADH-quinone oxidoreductase subunit J [Gemmataceae bacterium]
MTPQATFSTQLLPPILVGLVAIYLLLPRPQPYPRILGVFAGLAAFVFGGLMIVPEAARANVIEAILFYTFAGLAILGGVFLVTQSNPARGAVSFALVVLSTCGLFLLQAAPFLMAGTVIIYAGAIVVTFLFVIMLSQQHGPSDADGRSREPFLSCIAGGLLLVILLFAVREQYGNDRVEQVIAAARSAADSGKIDVVRDAVNGLGHTPGAGAIGREFEEIEPRLAELGATPAQIHDTLTNFADRVTAQKPHLGDVRPSDRVTLSAFSGTPVNKASDQLLPASNVVLLGRTLFSDYLLAIEMAGTLLLVATIGAIAITHRHARRPA